MTPRVDLGESEPRSVSAAWFGDGGASAVAFAATAAAAAAAAAVAVALGFVVVEAAVPTDEAIEVGVSGASVEAERLPMCSCGSGGAIDAGSQV